MGAIPRSGAARPQNLSELQDDPCQCLFTYLGHPEVADRTGIPVPSELRVSEPSHWILCQCDSEQSFLFSHYVCYR